MPAQRSFWFNSFLNFSSNVVVLVAAFLCLPLLITKLGETQFGLLAILWLFVGYVGVFDVGTAQASVKFLAEAIGLGDNRSAAGALQASVVIALIIGVLSGLALAGVSTLGVYSLLNVPDTLMPEARKGLQMIAFVPPAVLLQGVLKSVPLAFNRFGLANGVLVLNGLLQWGGSAVVLLLGGDFLDVVLLTVVARYGATLLLAVMAVRMLPGLRDLTQANLVFHGKKLLRFGGWVSVSQLSGPALSFLERFFVSGLLSLSLVAFFSVPNDVMTRLLAIPMSLVVSLLPFMSGGWTRESGRSHVKLLYQRSLKFVYIVVLPLAALGALLSKEILIVWLGPNFAEQSWMVFRILSLGLLFNALAQIPVVSLQALGRPDIPAKITLAELVLYAALCYVLTAAYGIIGTAAAWCIRVFLETLLLLWCVHGELKQVKTKFSFSHLWKSPVLLIPGAMLIVVFRERFIPELLVAAGILACLMVYGIGIWRYVLDGEERRLILGKVYNVTG